MVAFVLGCTAVVLLVGSHFCCLAFGENLPDWAEMLRNGRGDEALWEAGSVAFAISLLAISGLSLAVMSGAAWVGR
jgi:hypothetical protein